MKKSVAIIASVVLVGGALCSGGAWYTGTRLEALSPEQVTQFNADIQRSGFEGDILLRQLSFERGWFSSQARYAITVTHDGEDVTMELGARYEHGPFPLSALAHGQFVPKMAFVRGDLLRTDDVEPWFARAQGAEPPLWGEALVTYSGDADYRGGLSAFKIDEHDSAVDFKGATMQGLYTHATQRTVGSLTTPGFTASSAALSEQAFDLTVDEVQFDYDLARGRFDAHKGDVEMRIERVAVAQPGTQTRFAVDKLVYGGTSDEDERFLKGDLYLRGQSLTVNDLGLGDLSLIIKGDQFDGMALQRMKGTMRDLSAESGDDGPGPSLVSNALKRDFAIFLSGNPKLAVAPLTWKNGQGESTLDIRTELGDPDDGLDLPAALLVAQMLKTVNIDLRLHKAMVMELTATLLRLTQNMDVATASAVVRQQYDVFATTLIQAGLAKQDGEHLVCNVHYEDERITVNGRAVSPGELMGLMLQ